MELAKFTDYFKTLGKEQQRELVNQLLVLLDEPAGDISQAVSAGGQQEAVHCPGCESSHVRANGKLKGVQRYWCRGCGRHFSETTGKEAGALQSADAIAEAINRKNPLPCEKIHEMKVRIAKFREKAGYDGDYKKWVEKHRPVRLEEMS